MTQNHGGHFDPAVRHSALQYRLFANFTETRLTKVIWEQVASSPVTAANGLVRCVC